MIDRLGNWLRTDKGTTWDWPRLSLALGLCSLAYLVFALLYFAVTA